MRIRELAHLVSRSLSPARLRRRLATAVAAPGPLTLRVRARWSRTSLTGTAPVVVSLTSYGRRVDTVHHTLESIAGGRVRPRRVVLWLEDEALVQDPPAPLARMQRRGLEVRHTQDWGPHKKYYPYAASVDRHVLPLVTADDDVLYGYRWLAFLVHAHRQHPGDVIAHRAHRIVLRDGRIEPYARWGDVTPGEAGPRTFATGNSGVLYPPPMLDALREAGTTFTACAPRADDVWLHAMALRSGTTVRPCHDGLTTYRTAPTGGSGGLRTANIFGGGNDQQIAATYTEDEVALLWEDQLRAQREAGV